MNLPKPPKLTDLHVSASSLTSDPRWRKVLMAVAVLVAIAIAIPVLLSKPGKPAVLAALPPAPTVTTADVGAPVAASPQPAMSQARVNGAANNPFLIPAQSSAKTAATGTGNASAEVRSPAATSAKSASASTSESSTHAESAGVGTTTTANAAVTGATAGAEGTGTATRQPAQTTASSRTTHAGARGSTQHKSPLKASHASHVVPVATHTVTVVKTITKPAPYSVYRADVTVRQQGDAQGASYAQIARYQLLPADDGAFATFLGVRTDARTAVFMLASGIAVSGDGRCAPSSADCTFLTIEPGHSVTLEAPDWAGGKTFVLTYHSVSKVTASASVLQIDDAGRAVVRSAAVDFKALRLRTYGHFDGLLDMPIGHTLSAAL